MPRHFALVLLALFAVVVFLCSSTAVFGRVDFALTSMSATPSNGDGNSVIAGDFNNDGIIDLVTINYQGISFYKGLGGGSYAKPVQQSFSTTMTMGAFSPAFAADFNSDGKLDIVTAWGGTCYLCISGPVFILLGNGDGTFTFGQSITPPNGNAATVAIADFNGDHKPDLVVSDNVYGYTWIYLGKGDGTFTLSDTKSYGSFELVVGDFNADGKQDYAIAPINSGFTVALFLGKGDGTVGSPIFTSVCCEVISLAVGDFYGNQIQSIAALLFDVYTNDAYVYSMHYSNGTLVLGVPTSVGEESNQGPAYLYVATGDLNGDFKTDLFLSGGQPAYSSYMLGNGDGTFKTAQLTATNGSSVLVYPVVRDVNLDSRHDVIMSWITDGSTATGGMEQLRNLNATVNCIPPRATKLSVNICGLKSGQIVPSTFNFKAAGNAFSGVVKRMELWIDGGKVGQNLEDQLNVNATLSPGSHKATFVAVDSFDNYVSSSLKFTSQ